jgi:putative spermidine/putrescine transport system substrate-binding protein
MADETSKRTITPAGLPKPKGLSRRTVLKGAAASAGLAAGSGAISGFPSIWAQNIKDVTLLQVGGSYSAIIDIARKATEDLGFKVEMQSADHAALLNRLVTQPESLDIADTEFFFLMYTVPRGIIQPVDLTKYKWWDKVVPIFTKGQYPDGREVSRQGINPYEVQYVAGPDAREFHDGPTGFATAIPTVYNADTLGIRPDLLGREVGSWAELLNPEFKGRTALVDVPGSWTPPWRSRRAATSNTATRAT